MKIGQRWYSESEPELGLGYIEEVIDRNIKINYPHVQEMRIYNIKSAPLKRLSLEIGDSFKDLDGKSFIIKEVIVEEDFLIFNTECDSIIKEIQVNPNINFTRPDQRILSSSFDSSANFLFRYENLLKTRAIDQNKTKGYEGSRVKILPHQASLFHQVSGLVKPKIILCDEVGLGKTIQAGIILKNQIERSLISSCLIVVPDALQYQWFFELYKKFNLLFKTLGQDGEESFVDAEDANDNIDYMICSFENALSSDLIDKHWDAIIVDESHRIKKDSTLWEVISDINRKTNLSMFLTATPEALGLENFYNQLNLLDPTKYKDFEEFRKQAETFKSLPFNEKNLESYRAARNYFRNTRENLSKHENLFPKKTLNLSSITIEGRISDTQVIKEKSKVLIDFLEKNEDKKVLLIAKSKALILKLKTLIDSQANIKIALFHGDQTLLEKDRQAAYFQEKDGAQLLLSTEIGSEGRNFEFASELFLFDLPMQPSGLIQRIGRLDRIGQYNPITIHLPMIKNSIEESLYNLYSSFGVFTQFPKGINEFFENEQEIITQYLQTAKEGLLIDIQNKYSHFTDEMGINKDPFLDAHSYSHESALSTRKYINEFNEVNEIQTYLEKAFDLIGIDHEKLNSDAYFARPSDNMLIPAIEGLSYEGKSYTIERSIATHRDDLEFMNWEAPLPKALLNLFTSSEIGNTSICKTSSLERGLYFEFIFVLRASAITGLDSRSHLPLTPIRVLLGVDGKDYTKKYSKKLIDTNIEDITTEEKDFLGQNIKKEILSPLIIEATTLMQKRAEGYIESAKKSVSEFYHDKKVFLAKHSNDNLKAKIELVKLNSHLENVISSLNDNEQRLDSIRVIFSA